LDPILPGISGLEVLQQARKLYPAVRVVMMTGYPKKEILELAIADGAKEIMVYPILSEKLQEVAERWF
jgi:DNA-binding NtrC family response regulator